MGSRGPLYTKKDMFLLCCLKESAAAHGKCVTSTTTGKQELTKNMCVKEFEVLKSCFLSAPIRGTKNSGIKMSSKAITCISIRKDMLQVMLQLSHNRCLWPSFIWASFTLFQCTTRC
uniref:Uncharacterized protein n=1 Tax=Cyprinus carpio carpio TaxID=630221 RepID=A0A9J8BEA7_CYPCA